MKAKKKSFLSIDLDNIEEDWLAQPKLLREHAKALALSKKELEYAKVELEVYEAEMSKKIRNDPESYGIKTKTEKAIDAVITTRKKRIRLSHHIIECKYRMDMHQSAVNALDSKKKALENLVDLIGLEWIAQPRVRGRGKEVSDNFEKRRAREVLD